MKSIFKLGLSVSAILAITASMALAQMQKCAMSRYDNSTETTISGTVQDVQECQCCSMQGTRLTVKTDSGTLEVHLGPAAFIAKEGFTFAKGEAVEVVGSKAKCCGADGTFAREVTKDGKKLTLRDESGKPMWAHPQM